MTDRPGSFISYSANFEDVILHRIFGDQPVGFFVDVGAADPRMENDCKALYDQGWTGINIEPNPGLHQALLEQRPRDRSFGIALGAADGEERYYEVEGTGLSTLDPDEAARCRADGWTVIERVVETRTLRSLLDEAAPARFDLLKVDVEGWEEHVLRGNDWVRYRPSVILVEATLPERPIRRESGIAAFLADQGYRQAYFDGLNDFYVRGDFRGADGAFALPPNVFDRFESYRLREFPEHAKRLEAHLAEAKLYSDAEHAARLRKERDVADAQRILAEERAANAAALAAAHARIDRMTHDSIDRQNENQRLRASILLMERHCAAYAEQVEDRHRDCEELLILRRQGDSLRSGIGALEHRLADALVVADQCRALERETRDWIAAIRRSTSWKLTLPLRVGGRMFGRTARALRPRRHVKADAQ